MIANTTGKCYAIVMFRFRKQPKLKEIETSLDGLEIGSTGPKRLQFVLDTEGYRVIVKLTSEEARWLAYALNHWADDCDKIGLQ